MDITKLLLTNIKVNPAANDDTAIQNASRNGHLEIVRLLLADKRVNPAANGNSAYMFAVVNEYIDIERLLLTDVRVYNLLSDKEKNHCIINIFELRKK